ncbi:hypothetical protein [Methylobacterium marchantiae]|uniref:Aconitate hydratase n=1 Tax=Methylobacterium marchantiae TaxID=600331 RepID=A0ABW3WX30_9HYPH|nr:hypothetical protein AIGOOFII_1123 [Methylobacterium marchantiae]
MQLDKLHAVIVPMLFQGDIKPRQTMIAEITSADGTKTEVPLTCRIDTLDELEYFRNGGILPHALRSLAA